MESLIIQEQDVKHYLKSLKSVTNSHDFWEFNAQIIQKVGEVISFNKSILITLKDRKQVKNFAHSILTYVAQYYAIQANTQKAKLKLHDLVYHEEEVWKVSSDNNDEKVSLKHIIDHRKECHTYTSQVVKIEDEDFSYKKNRRVTIDFSNPKQAQTHYLTYKEWVQTLQAKYVGLLKETQSTDQEEQGNTGKALAIGSFHIELDRFSDVPYTINDDYESHACTTASPTINFYKSYDISQNIKYVAHNYNEVFLIGDRSIQQHLGDVINLADRGRIERFTLIGNQEPETNYDLFKWQWTKEEFNTWCHKPLMGQVRLKPTDENEWEGMSNGVEELRQHIEAVIKVIEELRSKYTGIRIHELGYFLNEYMRYNLPPDHYFLGDIQKKVLEYLYGDDQFKEAFYEKGEYATEIIDKYTRILEGLFTELDFFFRLKSPKYNHITSGLKVSGRQRAYPGGRYTINTRNTWQYAQQDEQLHNEQFTIGSIPIYDAAEQSFDKIIIDSKLNTSKAQFIFPFIFNRQQLELMLEAEGDVKLYLYKDLEDLKFFKVMEANARRFLKKVQHSDRSKLFPSIIYEASKVDASKESAEKSDVLEDRFYRLPPERKDFFELLYDRDDVDYRTSEVASSERTDQLDYTVIFDDGEVLEVNGSKKVIIEKQLHDKSIFIEKSLSNITKGDQLIIYRNLHPDKIYEILKNQDKTGLIKEIERASNLWFSTIRELHRQLSGDTERLQEKLKGKGVNYHLQTIEAYLRKERKFPRDANALVAIRSLALKYNLSQNYLISQEQLQQTIRRKKQFHSLSITLGRNISDAMLRYTITGTRGGILSKIDPDIFEVLTLNIKRNTVSKIFISE